MINILVSVTPRVSLATGPAMGQLTCLPLDPDGSRAGLWGPRRLECLLDGPIDPAVRISGEGAATAVRIVDVFGLARLARGLRGEAANANLDVKPKSEHERLPKHTQVSSSNPT